MAAMAALRHAGKRLVGGGRPMSTPAGLGRRNFTQQNLQSHGSSEKANVLMQVQQKKELLYDLICNHGYEVNGKMCIPNLRLLHHLSVEIKPRPDDYVWVYLRITHTVYALCMCVSPLVSLYASWIVFKVTKDALRGEEN
uniref:Uncharacterized protein n=1 Tax=Avena sativa TaxID=4498 RepID=A0ACD5T6J9_AVESA